MFLDTNYLLNNPTAVKLFAAVRDLPILDAHNHADLAALEANKPFADAWELFAATDHYVWSVMRIANVPETLITGPASNHDKFIALANCFDELVGNPVYEWIHLDLRFLGIEEILDKSTGELVWQKVNAALQKPQNLPQNLLINERVEVMCSTDDPADLLEHHDAINAKFAGQCTVRPTWRPDRILKLSAPDFGQYVQKLAARLQTAISDLSSLLAVLQQSHDYFAAHGCLASDHGLLTAPSGIGDETLANETFKKALSGQAVSDNEAQNYSNFLMGEFGEMNSRTNWVTQLHLGPVRNVRNSLYNTIGPDAGGDISDMYQNHEPPLIKFLNRFDNRLKVVLYCLDQVHQSTLTGLSHAFGNQVRLGSAWWLCDNPIGMKRQLEYIGSVDLLSNFAGMVSDSRKLLSYGSRFEMFRRVLCSVVGEMVENGQIPLDKAQGLVAKMCYDEPKKFFGF